MMQPNPKEPAGSHQAPKSSRPLTALTFDVEWWGRGHLVPSGVGRHAGLQDDLAALHRVLDQLEERQIKATFFVVSDDIEPGVLRRIADQGHEVASHSVSHPHFGRIPYNEWQKQLRDSKNSLENTIGTSVRGFRAPSWSVPFDKRGAFLELLLAEGYIYDSSFCSFQTFLYGDKRFERQPFITETGIIEIPLPLIGVPKAPWSGGFYWRVLPRFVLEMFVRLQLPTFFYFHPWELYASKEGSSLSTSSVVTNYGRRSAFRKFSALLDFLSKRAGLVTMNQLAQRTAVSAEC